MNNASLLRFLFFGDLDFEISNLEKIFKTHPDYIKLDEKAYGFNRRV